MLFPNAFPNAFSTLQAEIILVGKAGSFVRSSVHMIVCLLCWTDLVCKNTRVLDANQIICLLVSLRKGGYGYQECLEGS